MRWERRDRISKMRLLERDKSYFTRWVTPAIRKGRMTWSWLLTRWLATITKRIPELYLPFCITWGTLSTVSVRPNTTTTNSTIPSATIPLRSLPCLATTTAWWRRIRRQKHWPLFWRTFVLADNRPIERQNPAAWLGPRKFNRESILPSKLRSLG